ncbi:MAG: hypothetical protein ACXWWC_11350 [Chitinophagaceae bacterium]
MKKILSEKNIVVFLFIVAFVIFSLAQQDAKKVEKMYLNAGTPGSSLIKPSKQTAGNIIVYDKPAKTTDSK